MITYLIIAENIKYQKHYHFQNIIKPKTAITETNWVQEIHEASRVYDESFELPLFQVQKSFGLHYEYLDVIFIDVLGIK